MIRLALVATLLLLISCVTREQVEADIWIAEKMPSCTDEQMQFGIFRVVKCTANPTSPNCQNGEKEYEEFIPYCDPAIAEYLGMHREDVNKWLEKLTRPKKNGN